MPQKSTASPELRRIDDFERIRKLALAAGLEDGTFENIATAYGYFLGDELVGCAALKIEGAWFAVEWLAVIKDLRGKGLGSLLVGRIEHEARARGAERIWVVARAPEFFEKLGFRRSSPVEKPEGPTISNCILCRQYLRTCFPALLVKNL